MSISTLFRRKHRHRDAAGRLFDRIVAQSRAPAFYEQGGVPDSLDGRFDLMVLHVFLVVERLHRSPAMTEAAQAVLDRMFAVLDLNLREMGIQDMGIGKRIKAMAEGYNGRSAAYREALGAADDTPLRDALRRNVFGKVAADEACLAALLRYVRSLEACLAQSSDEALLRGAVVFPQPQFPLPEPPR